MMTRATTTTLCLLLALTIGAPTPANAKDPSPNEIVKKSLDHMVFRAKGADMKIVMVLRNKRGETRKRTLYAKSRKVKGLTRSLVRFLTPSDVAGTAFLFVENGDRPDDQYMFLPALKVTKRIAGRQKQAKFMGSDFSYADMEWRDLEEATYVKQADEKVGKSLCYVIDSKPNKKDAYSKVRSWIRQKDHVPLRTQFYDKAGKALKVLFIKEIKRVGGSLMVTQLKMQNRQTGHATFLQFKEIKLREDLDPNEFTVRALKQR
jgi:Outer membrane lipoprotein-sorting protein